MTSTPSTDVIDAPRADSDAGSTAPAKTSDKSKSSGKSRARKLFSWIPRRDPVEVKVAPRSDSDDRANRGSRDASLQQLKHGYNEVVETMSAIRHHLDEQSERSERMLTLMEQLPEVLQSIPESSRRQTQALQAIHEQIEHNNANTSRLSGALSDLAKATSRQETELSSIREDIGNAREQSGEMMGTLNDTLQHTSQVSEASAAAVSAVARQAERFETQTQDMFNRSQRQGVVMLVLTALLAAVVLCLAGYVAFKVSQLPTASPASTSMMQSITN